MRRPSVSICLLSGLYRMVSVHQSGRVIYTEMHDKCAAVPKKTTIIYSALPVGKNVYKKWTNYDTFLSEWSSFPSFIVKSLISVQLCSSVLTYLDTLL